MSSDKDDDLTDITELPDFNEEEDDQSFASLDELAKDIGLESTDESPPEFPTPPSFGELPEVDESESSFGSETNNFENNNFNSDDSFESENDFSSDDSFESENDFSSDDSFESENDFGSDDSFESENDFGSDDSFESENDFRSNDSFESENDFSSDESFESENDFGSDDSFESENDFGSDDSFESENDFASDDSDNNLNDNENSSVANFGEDEADDSDKTIEEETSSTESEDLPATPKERAYTKIEQEMAPETPPPSISLTSSSELLTPEPLPEKTKKTPLSQDYETKTHSSPPEQFEEFKNFARTMTYNNFSSEGNPPFSIILKNLSYVEDVEDITGILLELKIITQEDKDSTLQMLSRGQLLIPRLSEYAAIYLCHKLRRFDVEILMGLTEEISPPKSYESNDRGLSSKRTIFSNRKHNFNFKEESPFSEILVTTLPQISDYRIVKYLGVVTENKSLTLNDLSNNNIEDEIIGQIEASKQEDLHLTRIKRENMLASHSQNAFNYKDFYQLDPTTKKNDSADYLYQDLIEKLKNKAKASHANGIVGINFSITPVSAEEYLKLGPQYQILCSGNMVWLEKA